MANENSVRSYRDYDAYDRDAREVEPVVRGHAEGNPLADLARIMGQDETYAELLKTVARTRGEVARQEPEFEARHEDEHIDIPAMELRGASHDDGVDWDDLEAELAQYRQSAGPDAGADADFAHADDLRGGHHDWQADAGHGDELERQFAAEFERLHGAEHQVSPQQGEADHAGVYGAAVAAAAAGAAATWAMRSRQGADGQRTDHGSAADDQRYAAAHQPVVDDYADEAPPRRRRAGMTAVAAVLGLAVLGGGGVLAYRSMSGSAGAGGEPRVVRADPTPVRVAVLQAQDAKPVTDRVPGGDRVVSREERPVSVREQAAQVQAPPTPARVIPLVPAPTPAATAAAPVGRVTDPGQPIVRTVNAVPVTGSGLPAAVQPAPVAAAAPARVVEEPRRVRTVQVGPDGAPLAAPAPVMPAPAVSSQSPLSVVPVAAAAAPPPVPAALASAESRAAPVPAPRPVQALRVARAEPAAAEPARPVATSRAAAAPQPLDLGPQRTASVRGAAVQTGGTFVQISSHQSDAEARSAFTSAQRRFPMLQGQAPNIRTAEIPGRGTWHRLRVGPFSREEAQGFCQRLKSAGGSCVLN